MISVSYPAKVNDLRYLGRFVPEPYDPDVIPGSQRIDVDPLGRPFEVSDPLLACPLLEQEVKKGG
jgi:hypothetical protein